MREEPSSSPAMTTTGNSRPLALCMVISRCARSGCLLLRPRRRAATDGPRNRQRRLRAPAFVFAGGRHELHEVLDASLGFLGALVAKVPQVTGLIEHLADRDRHGLAAVAICGQRPSRSRKTGATRWRAPAAGARRAPNESRPHDSRAGRLQAGARSGGRSPAPSRVDASIASITPLPMPRAGR